MEDDTTFSELFPFVRLLPCLAVSITSLLATNPSLLKPSVFEEESHSNDEDTDEVPHEDSDQEGPGELVPDEEAPEEVDPDEFNSKNLNPDAVVTLADALFTSKTSSLEARSLRCTRDNKLGGPLTGDLHAELHERTVMMSNDSNTPRPGRNLSRLRRSRAMHECSTPVL